VKCVVTEVSCYQSVGLYYRKDRELLKLLEKLQRRPTKLNINMKRLSNEDRLRCLNLWLLEKRRNRQDLREVFKMSKGMTTISLQEPFILADNNKGIRGHSLKIRQKAVHSGLLEARFLNSGH